MADTHDLILGRKTYIPVGFVRPGLSCGAEILHGRVYTFRPVAEDADEAHPFFKRQALSEKGSTWLIHVPFAQPVKPGNAALTAHGLDFDHMTRLMPDYVTLPAGKQDGRVRLLQGYTPDPIGKPKVENAMIKPPLLPEHLRSLIRSYERSLAKGAAVNAFIPSLVSAVGDEADRKAWQFFRLCFDDGDAPRLAAVNKKEITDPLNGPRAFVIVDRISEDKALAEGARKVGGEPGRFSTEQPYFELTQAVRGALAYTDYMRKLIAGRPLRGKKAPYWRTNSPLIIPAKMPEND